MKPTNLTMVLKLQLSVTDYCHLGFLFFSKLPTDGTTLRAMHTLPSTDDICTSCRCYTSVLNFPFVIQKLNWVFGEK